MTSRRLRLRRRLYLYSAPVIVIMLLVSAKLISVVTAGGWAQDDFARHDLGALESDISVLRVFDVIEPAKTAFTAADLDVLKGRLPEAESQFVESLAGTDPAESCPVRVNLLLVRETLGDLATREGRRDDAENSYRAAITTAEDAPQDCFAGNDDANEDRRAIRADSIARLQRKLDALDRPPGTPLPPATAAPPPPPNAPLVPTTAPLPGLPPAEETQPGDSGAGGPGPNMPELPESGSADGPILGPDSGGPENGDGSGVLDPISPDRIPTAGGGSGPGRELGSGSPDELLRRLLDNSNAYGDNRE